MSRTEELNVLGQKRGPALRKGKNVIKMKIFFASTQNALSLIPLPDLKLYDSRYEAIVIDLVRISLRLLEVLLTHL